MEPVKLSTTQSRSLETSFSVILPVHCRHFWDITFYPYSAQDFIYSIHLCGSLKTCQHQLAEAPPPPATATTTTTTNTFHRLLLQPSTRNTATTVDPGIYCTNSLDYFHMLQLYSFVQESLAIHYLCTLMIRFPFRRETVYFLLLLVTAA